MATYNGAAYLAEQLETLITQSKPPLELVVTDDASTDSTIALLQDFAKQAPFPVDVVRGAHNRGSAAAFAESINRCRGDWIAFCDQDDRWRADKLATIERWIALRPDAAGFFSDADAIDEAGSALGRTMWQSLGFDQSRFCAYPARVMLTEWAVFGNTFAFRADLRRLAMPLPDVSAHSHHPLTGHDSWIALVISCVATVVPIPQPLIEYRLHAEQQVGLSDPSDMPASELARRGVRDYATTRVMNNVPELETIVDRLTQRGYSRDDLNATGRDVVDWLRHYRTRSSLPARRLRRVMPVAKEATSGRYRRYSSGYRSAIKDLIVSGS